MVRRAGHRPGERMRPQLLLWDIDGTILRAKGAGRRAMNQAFAETFGIEGAFDDVVMHGRIDLDFIAEVFADHEVDKRKLEDFLFAYYRALQKEATPENMELLPGVVDVLQEAERRGYLYNALGTGNVEVGARIKLDAFDLNHFFPVGGFCERPAHRYEVLDNAIEQAKAYYGIEFAPRDVIVIGDTVRDIEAARKLKVRVVAVATGGSRYEELAAHQPDLLLPDLLEQARLFAWIEEHASA
ncbi:HAD family hydrolase [Alicyclobacillus cellulosilyticus]|uniref:HAD family hydrolase n=1 Tax=Alicyclobacillus cellulosilyticus TaxID=1003997 RepID=UPI001E3FFCEA|nr:HAD hydrolase-like protein [Alicyclobacillus cellulosilyticus]